MWEYFVDLFKSLRNRTNLRTIQPERIETKNYLLLLGMEGMRPYVSWEISGKRYAKLAKRRGIKKFNKKVFDVNDIEGVVIYFDSVIKAFDSMDKFKNSKTIIESYRDERWG